MSPTPLFTWIHLSDIHIGHGDAGHRADQGLVLAALREDIAGGSARGLPRPDALLVTGDIAFSGNGVVRAPDTESREYERARAFLLGVAGAVGLDARAVFVVPGNHDVNRGADRDRNVRRLVERLREDSDKGSESVDESVDDDGDVTLLRKRMAAYLDFAKGFAPPCPALYWLHRF